MLPREAFRRDLERLEFLERLAAAAAPADGLARCRAELAADLRVLRLAVRTRRCGAGAEELHEATPLLRRPWRRDAVGLELRARLRADPVGRPCGRVSGLHARVRDARRGERADDVVLDHLD